MRRDKMQTVQRNIASNEYDKPKYDHLVVNKLRHLFPPVVERGRLQLAPHDYEPVDCALDRVGRVLVLVAIGFAVAAFLVGVML